MRESLSEVHRGSPQPERYVASAETRGPAPARQPREGADLTLSGPSSSPHHPLRRDRLACPVALVRDTHQVRGTTRATSSDTHPKSCRNVTGEQGS